MGSGWVRMRSGWMGSGWGQDGSGWGHDEVMMGHEITCCTQRGHWSAEARSGKLASRSHALIFRRLAATRSQWSRGQTTQGDSGWRLRQPASPPELVQLLTRGRPGNLPRRRRWAGPAWPPRTSRIQRKYKKVNSQEPSSRHRSRGRSSGGQSASRFGTAGG